MSSSAPIANYIYPFANAQEPPLSDRLIHALEAHASAEAHDVATCQQLAQRSSDPVVSLLINLIVEDQQRHHGLLQSLVRRLEEDVEFVASPANTLPVPSLPAPTSDPEMAATVRGLIRDQHEGARHLRHLARQEPTLYGGLYQILLESIARDSEKHAAILRYLLLRDEGRLG